MISKSKWLSLVIISMAALVFMGINSLKADKPIYWEWSVTIPDVNSDYNLYAAAPGGKVFPDSGPFSVRVAKSKRKAPPFSTDFRFWIENDPENLTNNDKIGFQFLDGEDLELRDKTNIEERSCSFPGFGKCLNNAEAPACMQSFLVDNFHPYSFQEGVPNLNDYTYLWIRITLDVDIEQKDLPAYPSGRIYIDLIKSDDVLPTGCEDFHNLVISRDVAAESGIIEITQFDTNTWVIVVDTNKIAPDDDLEGDGDTIRFTEAYWGFSGKGKGRLETKKPLKAKAPFKFKTTWTRS